MKVACTAKRTSQCQCGEVRLEASAEPILAAVCYCDDCQAGARRLEELPGAPSVLDEDGGASYLIYRDDRFSCVAGADRLEGHKLREKSPTTRYVASCCNTAMYLKFGRGHWVSAYRTRFEQVGLPPVEMRTNTRFRTFKGPYPDKAPTHKRFPLMLFAKLAKAR